ncbi:hypothetical protein D0A40_15325 [Xanthomonas campestris pv. raphani]|nr:hypothetical protein D0A40_15325 [Xanthomonas campestris pv. raphani]
MRSWPGCRRRACKNTRSADNGTRQTRALKNASSVVVCTADHCTYHRGPALETHVHVVTAIEAFQAWHTPWTFFDSVCAALQAQDRPLLQQVWAAACGPSLWRGNAPLAVMIDAVQTALATRYPWLSSRACGQLARAAAYAWR